MASELDENSARAIEDELEQLKAKAIQATASADALFYDGYLADDAIGVTPTGVFNKAQILKAMAGGQAFKSTKIEDSEARALGKNVGLVTYKATFERQSAGPLVVFVSTVYARKDGVWKGIFYQQTPLPSTAV